MCAPIPERRTLLAASHAKLGFLLIVCSSRVGKRREDASVGSSSPPRRCPRVASRHIRRSAMTTHEDLRYDVSGRIAEISLARPPVNALSLSLLEQLIAALRRAPAHENDRAAVLTSA